jgi:hypothetical protein
VTSFSPCRGQRVVIVYLVSVPNLVQLPLPTLDGLAYPRGADGLVHQCAWCGRVLDRGGRFRIWAQLLRGDVSHGCCSNCAPILRPRVQSSSAS